MNKSEKKTKAKAEFGDFQTPDLLAKEILQTIEKLNLAPKTVIEPSCGQGSFLFAAGSVFPNAKLIGVDINSHYLSVAAERVAGRAELVQGNFFDFDWAKIIASAEAPLLVLGNPPWITNSHLGVLGSTNLPAKTNFQNMRGLDAVTGKSNFDISEWMILKNLEWIHNRTGTLAILCKTAVARKILTKAWKTGVAIADARIYSIDAKNHFNAAVSACLLVVSVDGKTSSFQCAVYPALESDIPSSHFGFVGQVIVANIERYNQHSAVAGSNQDYVWRSGIKHDCSSIMELEKTSDGYKNGLGQLVQLEATYLHPLAKSADVASSERRQTEKFVIVTQRRIGDKTSGIESAAPLTWAYLQSHDDILKARGSVIYRNKPRFSIFGVGSYSFTPWKIAISGFYKRLGFRLYGPRHGKPVIFDDTVYFLPFESFAEANLVFEMLNSEMALGLLESMIFWDEKRPITTELLKRLDITKLANSLGRSHELLACRNSREAEPLQAHLAV
jgi:hypothetical protein